MITVEFEPGTGVQMARLAIHERLEAIRNDFLPGVSPPRVSNYMPEDPREQPFLRYTMAGPCTPGVLLKVTNEVVVPPLRSVDGASGVDTV